MPYVPNTDDQRREMLAAIGVKSFEDLLDSIPAETRVGQIRIPSGLSEMETLGKMHELASRTQVFAPERMFAGAGIYSHYIPPLVTQLSTRSEFFTAYTPYQPEVSQGLLQTIF